MPANFEKITHWLALLLPILLLASRTLADLAVVITGFLFIYKSFTLNQWEWLKNTWVKASLCFWLYLLCINSPLSDYPTISFLYALFFIRWPLFACALAYWIFCNKLRQLHFIQSLCLVIILIITDTIIQYVLGTDMLGHAKLNADRLTGPFNGPVPGITILRVLFIAFYMIYFSMIFKSINQRFTLLMIGIMIGILFMMMTGERMALILFVLGGCLSLLGFFLEFKLNKKILYFGMASTLSAIITLMLIAPSTADRAIYSIFEKLAHFWQSDYGLVFKAAIEAWSEHPIFGSGLHTYQQTCESMGLLKSWGMACTHAHNLYLQLAAETGVVGLVFFIALVMFIYIDALKPLFLTKRWSLLGLNTAILSVCFFPFIGGISLFNNGVAALVWLSVGWALSLRFGLIQKILA